MDEARDFLASVVKSSKDHVLVSLCLRTIVRLGIVRSSAEDFLIAVNLINQNPLLADTVDLRADIKSLPLKRPVPLSTDQITTQQVSIKEAKGILKQNLVTILEAEAKIEHIENIESWTTDGSKIYAIKDGIH